MPVTVEGSYVESVERVQPSQANNYGNAHGGEVVKLMDELAAIAAMGVAGETCVTAHIGSADFRSPIAVGDVIELSAYVYEAGESSLQVRVDVEARDPRATDSRRTTAACFTMVAVDDDGDPVPVPSVTADTERGRELVANAPC
jgi:acyl-CoA hydrolase